MRSLWLRRLNPVILAVGFLVAHACLGTLWVTLWKDLGIPRSLQPDLLTIVAVWLAIQRTWLAGGILVLILGMMLETLSAVPQGLAMLSGIGVYFLIRAYRTYFVIPHFQGLLLVLCGTTLLAKLQTLGLLTLLGRGERVFLPWMYRLPWSVLATVVVGVFAFRWLERLDRLTDQDFFVHEVLQGSAIRWRS